MKSAISLSEIAMESSELFRIQPPPLLERKWIFSAAPERKLWLVFALALFNFVGCAILGTLLTTVENEWKHTEHTGENEQIRWLAEHSWLVWLSRKLLSLLVFYAVMFLIGKF